MSLVLKKKRGAGDGKESVAAARMPVPKKAFGRASSWLRALVSTIKSQAWCCLLSMPRHMKESDSVRENNYTFICVWQLRFIPLACDVKLEGDVVESVFSASLGLPWAAGRDGALGSGAFLVLRGVAFCALAPVAGRRSPGKVRS